VAEQAFKDANCTLTTLSNYNALIALAKETGYVKEHQIDALLAWRQSPETWGV